MKINTASQTLSNENYHRDQKNLLKYNISSYYIPDIKFDPNPGYNPKWRHTSPIELIIRPECNQKCEYCYIHQHGDELYPHDIRLTNDLILKNLDIFLNFLLQNKVIMPSLDIFAGDLFYDNLVYDVYDKLLNYYSKFTDVTRCIIKFPTNGRFFVDPEHQIKILEYQEKFNAVGVDLLYSISTDGLYGVDSREKDVDQNYFDKLFEFSSKIRTGFHPMVSPENVDNWEKNLYWWTEMFTKYKLTDWDHNNLPYFLECRNDNWTPELVLKFRETLRKVWSIRLKSCNNDVELFTRQLLGLEGRNYNIIGLYQYCGKGLDDTLACNINKRFVVNLQDMSIPMCHRLTYPQFTAGKFIVENDKIIDVEPYDCMHTWVVLRHTKPILYPKCETCEYRFLCCKGCLGSQYEHSGEILFPIECVCELEKAKINTLIDLYNSTGVLDEIINKHYLDDNPLFLNTLIKFSLSRGYKIYGLE